jgi:hypothetical protein
VAGAALLTLLSALPACSLVWQRALAGQWVSTSGPKRTLDLFEDHTYALRFSSGVLNVVSALLGPETGSWRVEGTTLVLTHHAESNAETVRRWPINDQHSDEIVLAGERWRRVRPGGPPTTRKD